MEIIQGTTEIQFDFPTAVTLGKFDGIHRGHQKLIHELRRMAGTHQKIVVFTFDRSPAVVDKEVPVLTTREEKRRLMAAIGVDYLIEYPFTEATRRMDAEKFVREILIERLCMKTIAVGPDCRFGYERRGDVAFLEGMSDELQFCLHVVEKERTGKDDRIVSSSRIKEELQKGNIEEVNRLLGYLYSVCGHAVDKQGTLVSATLRKEKGAWLIEQNKEESKYVLPCGRYFSKVWFDDLGVRGVTEIRENPLGHGELLTTLYEPVSEKHREFVPEISIIAQFYE